MKAILRSLLITGLFVTMRSQTHGCTKSSYLTKTIFCTNLILQTGEHLNLEGDYKEATYFSCISCRIPSISSEFFNGLQNLEDLSLGHSGISEIDPKAFQGMKQLKQLYLSGNIISDLQQGLFTDLHNLEELKLQFNDLTKINTDTFNSLNKLSYLDLCGNELREIQPKLLDPLINLQYLNLSFNKLSILKPGIFKSVPKLLKLNLDHNRLYKFDQHSFQGLENLQFLYLNGNHLQTDPIMHSFKSITEGSFSKLKNLILLNLGQNQLNVIDDNSFEGLTNLKYLNLNYNFILILDKNAFLGLSNLVWLDLGLNILLTVHDDTFAKLENLQTLKLNHNSLTSLPEKDFNTLTKLESLFINDNLIKSLDAENFISHLPNFANISLNNNTWPCDQLQKIVEVFENHHVQILDNYTRYWPNEKGIGCKDNFVKVIVNTNKSTEKIDYGKSNTYLTADDISNHLEKFEKEYKSHSIKLTVMTAVLTVAFLIIVLLISAFAWFYIYRRRQVNPIRYNDGNNLVID